MNFVKPVIAEQMSLFSERASPASIADLSSPETYTGLAGFHKYWGKKPVESLSYLIENLTCEEDTVLDPFLGSGLIARESLLRNRRFIGIDINPFSVEHATFLLQLPTGQEYYRALIEIEQTAAEAINQSYQTSGGRIASHYLWENNNIISIWIKPEQGKSRIEILPEADDYERFLSFQDYESQYVREMQFFTNSRINVKPAMSIRDLFSGRALRNIDLLVEAVSNYPRHLKRALLLTLTSSVGQMSNMVFAIKNRKKNAGLEKIEVGSWVIGYWLPETHFEINVWNCIRNRAAKLLKALPHHKEPGYHILTEPSLIAQQDFDACLIQSDCRTSLAEIPSDTVSLICTDPPHSDRIPYLELSELWNSILGYPVDFEREIVVSNAKERNKSKAVYNAGMSEFFLEASRVLKPEGYVALYFNARDEESWQYLKCLNEPASRLKFTGAFPMTYSAASVVQDNRRGAMKHDYVLVYQKQNHGKYDTLDTLPESLAVIPGWSYCFPENRSVSA